MNILNTLLFLINDENYLKNLSCVTYKISKYEFIEIRDKRNGEIYEFYRLIDKENNWTFNKSVYSFKEHPYNIFERYNEYDIKYTTMGDISSIQIIN